MSKEATQEQTETEILDWNSPQLNGPDIEEEIERKPIRITPIYHSDKRFYQIVVRFLGLTMLICTGGAIALAFFDKGIPDIIVAIGSAAIGALAGLFAPTQR
jgi:predicted phage tail protein